MKQSTEQVLVLGAGESGCAAAVCLREEGGDVTVLDEGAVDPAREAELRDWGIGVVSGASSIPCRRWVRSIVSPGFPVDHPWLCHLERENVPVVSELELGWTLRKSKMISVTGSNGKSTLVRLIRHILTCHGVRAIEGGNCGPPLCRVAGEDVDWLVVEVSSFQLEHVAAFRSEISVLLNLQPNHLDRHGTMETYLDTKARIFAAAAETDLGIVPTPLLDEICRRVEFPGRWETFGTDLGADCSYLDGFICRKGRRVVFVADGRFRNRIMGHTLAAAVAVAADLGIEPVDVVGSLPEFTFLPHRMETVGVWEGVTFINDSKSTTLSSTAAALERCSGPVRLIAGGISKEKTLSFLAERLEEKAKAAFVMGRDAERLASAWRGSVPVTVTDTLEEAFAGAVREARPGDTVLLSPGCASFDQFESYAARGRHFRKLIDGWARETAPAGKE